MKTKSITTYFVILTGFFTYSCLAVKVKDLKRERGVKSGHYTNASADLTVGEGRIFYDNPVVVMNNYKLPEGYDMNNVLRHKRTVIPISDRPLLEMNCSMLDGPNLYTIENCFKNLERKYAHPLLNEKKKWGYNANSTEFLQVNVFGHSKMLIEKWMENLKFLYTNMAYDINANSLLVTAYDTSIPQDIFHNRGFWFGRGSQMLLSYSNCDIENNAYYSPAENVLCYGKDSGRKNVYFAQDPTVIYHEIGHALQKIMLNLRNWSAGIAISVDLGITSYDEAGAIGEGVSDYFSYFMNQRTHFAEWALGRFHDLSRPLTEDDPLHVPGISSQESERISYPEYLLYEPNNVHNLYEDIHNAGMIVSHYLVALTKDLQESCSWNEQEASRYVMSMLIESYAEMGDLSSKGSDNIPAGFLHLDSENSLEWITKVHPINYRKFAQTMAKKLYLTLSDGQALRNRHHLPYRCGDNLIYSKDKIESLLDMYGLLLFDTYNLDGNGIVNGHSGTHTDSLPETNPVINHLNRKRTVTIKKKHLIFGPKEGVSKAYIFDKRSNIQKVVQELTANGQISISSQIPSDLSFNNGNGKISPGEVVGVALNLYNNSNTTMGGVQILANDWDHVKYQTQIINGESVTRGFPCHNLGDDFPKTLSQGAADLSTGESVQGGCDYTTRYNGKNKTLEPLEELAPACLVQMNAESGTQWVQQDEYLRHKNDYDESKCLGDRPQDCLVRVVRGADQSWVGQIPAKSSWSANLFNDKTGKFDFKSGHLIYLEINSEMITPGTIFSCRFRGRFTNCEDCFQDPGARPNSSLDLFDDFLDYEYSGASPFKIFNFTFTIID